MIADPTWGVVATIKAPAQDILNFAAHYLDLGAHRIHIYLDDDAPTARVALKAHPKCRVTLTDTGHWTRRRAKGRPEGHQHRQSLNATHCYNRRAEVDWLFHTDVDEFLLPSSPLAPQLAALPAATLSARVRPVETLAPDPADPPAPGQTFCKSFALPPQIRRAQTNAIYPNYGDHLNGGFLSHVEGKIFVRTGLPNITLRIHNAFIDQVRDATSHELSKCTLVHMHAQSWEHWRALYTYRLNHGSYREALKPAPLSDGTPLNKHALFSMLERQGGPDALRAFYTEVCMATPSLRARLAAHDHLHCVSLALDDKRARHFPGTI